jgi:hypothetical protein
MHICNKILRDLRDHVTSGAKYPRNTAPVITRDHPHVRPLAERQATVQVEDNAVKPEQDHG